MHAIEQIPYRKEDMRKTVLRYAPWIIAVDKAAGDGTDHTTPTRTPTTPRSRLQGNLDSIFVQKMATKNILCDQVFLFVQAEGCPLFCFFVRKSKKLFWFGGKKDISLFIAHEGSRSFGKPAFRLCAGC